MAEEAGVSKNNQVEITTDQALNDTEQLGSDKVVPSACIEEGKEIPDITPPPGRLVLDNDGSKFFDALNVMGSEVVQLSAEDIAGGMQSLSTNLSTRGKESMSKAYTAIQQVDIKNGWGEFKQSVAVPETRQALMRAPLGAVCLLAASMLYVFFCLIFMTKRYGPTIAQNTSVIIQEKSELFNSKVILPLKQKLRPMITEAKERIDNMIQERLQAQTANISVIDEEEEV